MIFSDFQKDFRILAETELEGSLNTVGGLGGYRSAIEQKLPTSSEYPIFLPLAVEQAAPTHASSPALFVTQAVAACHRASRFPGGRLKRQLCSVRYSRS